MTWRKNIDPVDVGMEDDGTAGQGRHGRQTVRAPFGIKKSAAKSEQREGERAKAQAGPCRGKESRTDAENKGGETPARFVRWKEVKECANRPSDGQPGK
ncbi:hypothetical protein AA0488_2285 [Kozakia baliensis NRIC 0488]|nr:hypothetical protein AA0488_2285 [Kozakia baliensis NRIC 0488]GEL62823.1 hypothetical protein KBA01_01090 [Kozakia baliensis]